MPRVFVGLAIGNVVVLLAAAATGRTALDSTDARHVLLALFSLLLSCLIQVALMTYLSVAGKIVAQALHLGHLDLAPLADVRRLKRTMTSLIAVVLAGVVFATATGAATWQTEEKSVLHMAAAAVLLAAHLWAFFREYKLVVEMASILERTLWAYDEHRTGRPVDDEEG
ncbi:MAG: hypothetical protein ACYTFA_06475 [Planctomycetota bacterium]|jgi:hypothetical protein